MIRFLFVLPTVLWLSMVPSYAQQNWFKGNLHAHTIRSDGKSTPEEAISWYKKHGYHFAVISDHNLLVEIEPLRQVYTTPGSFLIISGEEITDRLEKRPVHLNALGISKVVPPTGGKTVAELINNNVLAVELQGGIAILNHPNGVISQSIGPTEILGSARVRHFEVCCSDFKGGSGHPSTDEIWDQVLTAGKVLFGVAADDAHDFAPGSDQPGSAWIMIKANELSEKSILDAIRNGAFYASSGVELTSYQSDEKGIHILLKNEGFGFKTFFIGKGGNILRRDESDAPSYTFSGAETYVRVRIERSDGAYAWTQPELVKTPK